MSEKRSLPILNKYERAVVIGYRAKQISKEGKTYLEDKELISTRSAEEIAMIELNRKLIPFIISRRMPDGTFEYWDLKDLDVTY